MTDTFSKYVELVAIKSKEAQVVARAIFKWWFCRFSAPQIIVTDQGTELCNQFTEELCKLWNINKKRTSPYHPQTNSGTESYNRTLIKYMRAVLDNTQTLDWEIMLPVLMLSYNCHVHRSTMESPFFLMYLHDPQICWSVRTDVHMTYLYCR
jgi:transposase InsO family protein